MRNTKRMSALCSQTLSSLCQRRWYVYRVLNG